MTWKPVEEVLRQLNARLITFTVVRRLVYAAPERPEDEACSVILDLKQPGLDGHAITLQFSGVESLAVKEWGGGLTQLMGLVLTDVAFRGWDRVRWELEDAEYGRLRVTCSEVRARHISDRQEGGGGAGD